MIETLQQETRDALRRLNTQGNLSFAGLKDIGASLKRLEVEGILTTAELLDVASMLDLALTAKRYGENEGTSMTDRGRESFQQDARAQHEPGWHHMSGQPAHEISGAHASGASVQGDPQMHNFRERICR